MKILIVHNKYAQYGGEDKIVEQQYSILKKNGIDTKVYYKDNKVITKLSKVAKLKLIKDAYCSKKTRNELDELFKNFKPDIVHVHNIYPIISPSIYEFFKERNIPIVQTLHNYRFICPNGLMFANGNICEKCLEKHNFYECLHNKCYHNSYIQSFWYSSIIDKAYKKGIFNDIQFVSLNRFIKEKMIQKGYNENKIDIIPNCAIKMGKAPLEFDKKDYYLYIGRLSPEKGINTLIKAFKDIKTKKLKIVGDGILRDRIQEYINKNKINNIELLGFKSGEEKCKLLSEAKALIVPSEWYENFPTVVLEAFSLGTLVIGSSVGGLQYMIEDGYNGMKFLCSNAEDLQRKVLYIDNKKDNIMKFSENAYKTYKEKYTEEVYYENHMKVYEKLISRGY